MPGEVVLDASVAVKCFLDEEGSDAAKAVVRSHARMVAPDLIFAELASVAAKRVRRGHVSADVAGRMLSRAPDLLDEVFPLKPLAPRAFELAVEHGFSAYDALYLALAQARGARMVTADARLAARAEDAGLAALVEALGAA